MSEVQRAVQNILDKLIADGLETVLQVAVYHRGVLVVDAWAATPGRKIDGNTLFPIYSTGKGVASTAVHILVQRGVLSWEDPIARWWPEFAANGKQQITLRQALDHTSGMANLPEHGVMADLADWDKMCRAMAAMAPAHTPGSERQYHAVTHSWLLGETARRADGRDFARIVREEIAEPLGLDGLFFGIPDSERPRLVNAEPNPPGPGVAPTVPSRPVPLWILPLEDMMNRTDVRRCCLPASNGIMNARSVARHYAALVGNGKRLLSDTTLDGATEHRPLPSEKRASHALGYGLNGPDSAPGVAFGHGGYGGSTGWADRRYDLAVGFAKARMNGGRDEIWAEVRRCLSCPA